MYKYRCIESGWDGVNFFQSRLYGAVLGICQENAGNTPMSWLLLKSTCTASRSSLFPPLSPFQDVWRRPSPVDIPWHITSCSAIKMEEEEGGFFGSQGGCCLETGCASVCLWEVVNDLFCFTCFSPLFPSHTKLYLSQPTSFFAFALPILPVIPLGVGKRGRVSSCMGAQLLAVVNSPH